MYMFVLCTHTWNWKRLYFMYSARMSNILTICENISTLCPVACNLTSSLSKRYSLPLPLSKDYRLNISY